MSRSVTIQWDKRYALRMKAQKIVEFVFNERKATQAAALLIRKSGGAISLLSLMKLLYLADRRAIIETGHSITGDRLFSMPHGPVPSKVYNLASSNTRVIFGSSPWAESFRRTGNSVTLLADPGCDELSKYDHTVLGSIYAEFGHLSPWALRGLTHKLPEYRDPNGSSIRIDPVEILKLAGIDASEIEAIVAEADDALRIRKVLDFVQR